MRHPASSLTPATVLVSVSACCFLTTALVGVGVAYDRRTALLRFALLAFGLFLACVIAWAEQRHAKTVLSYVGLGAALLAAGASVVFLLGLYPNSGAVASGIIVLLPLGVGGVLWHRKCQLHRIAQIGTGALVVALLGLVWSLERTAWLGLAAGVASAGYLFWRFRRDQAGWPQHLGDVLLLIGIVGGITFLWQVFTNPATDEFVRVTPVADMLVKRLSVWRDSLSLVQDYRYSGSGLGSTAMVYSTYILLLDVPFYYHAHNLYLQVAVEQGVPGMVMFLSMGIATLVALITAYRESGPNSRLFCLTTLTSLAGILIYGLFDAEIYVTAMVSILFLPFGCAFALHLATQQRRWSRHWSATDTAAAKPSGHLLGAAGLLPFVLIGGLFLSPRSLANLHANLGAVAQTRAELSLYHWPEWQLQDELRREDQLDLTAAHRYYQVALIEDPQNVTAHERLGQIALSQGDYEVAQAHLETALQMAPQRQAVRQMLGEVYAVTGRVEAASALWQTIDTSPGQLAVRQWWYQHLHAEQEAAWIGQAMLLHTYRRLN